MKQIRIPTLLRIFFISLLIYFFSTSGAAYLDDASALSEEPQTTDQQTAKGEPVRTNLLPDQLVSDTPVDDQQVDELPDLDISVSQQSVPEVEVQVASIKKSDASTDPGNVTLDFKDADIRNVLRLISYKARVNIVATPEVLGNVTIRLFDVPWEKALNTIVTAYGYGYEWLNNKVIMVSTLEKLAEQRLAQDAAAANEPLDTQTFRLNYSRSEDIMKSIETLVSPRGKITLESRTNTLIVRETKTNLIRIGEIIKSLDKMTPQVMIEAKIIETTLGDTENLGIDWTIEVALSGSARPTSFPFQTDAYKGTGNKMFPYMESPDHMETTTTTTQSETGVVLSTTTTQEVFNTLVRGFPAVAANAFTYGTLDFSQFQTVLEILKKRTDTKVLSNPRITTLNNQQAEILVGSIVPIPNYEYSKDTGTRVVSGYTDQKIGIGLTVTPNINEEDYVTLIVEPTIDQITGFTGPNNERPIISTRNAQTNVMIKDGETLVIGGLIAEKKIEFEKKVPILGDIPIIKYLFSKKEHSIDRTELLIFITPYIIRDSTIGSPTAIARLQQQFSDAILQQSGIIDDRKREKKE
ncbi:MAG: type IV pilus secretin PilQ [Candidatus Omnitrophica bacterium]|nr:type IV pilus secretin PilQ [Candidatus Omnitrophota bacterium]